MWAAIFSHGYAFLIGFCFAITVALALRPTGVPAVEHFNMMFDIKSKGRR